MKTYAQYRAYKRPKWAPPARVFGPVWRVLYLLIAVSLGYIGYAYLQKQIPAIVALPFALNLVFNFAFTFVQFRIRIFVLASLDVTLVLATLLWGMMAAYPYLPWVAYLNIPYLAWVYFAVALE